MIQYYYSNLRDKKAHKVDSYKPGCWVNVISPTTEEIEFLVKRFKLDVGHIEDSIDPEEMPRLEKEGETTYIFVRYSHTNQNQEFVTAPLLFVVGPDFMLTISENVLPKIDQLLGGKINFATTQRTKLVLVILDLIVSQYEIYLNKVGRQINLIRSRLRASTRTISSRDFIDFVLIEDQINDFLSALQPTRAILRRLTLGRHIQLFEDDQELVEDLLLNTEQSIEECKAHIKSIINIREAYATITSNELNRSMKVLTAATVLITLPNVIFGMYGMNIHLPLQNHGWAFFAIITTSLVLLLIVLLIGRKKRIF